MLLCWRWAGKQMPERVHLDLRVPAQTVSSGHPVHLDVCFDEHERRSLCERFSFIDLHGLEGKLILVQLAEGCWAMKGRLEGQVTQACVVSGKPTVSPLVIELEERFVSALTDQAEVDAMDVDVDLLVDGNIPVGESLSQWIGVCAPAWPRAADVPLLEEPEAAEPENHPFAKLSELKK